MVEPDESKECIECHEVQSSDEFVNYIKRKFVSTEFCRSCYDKSRGVVRIKRSSFDVWVKNIVYLNNKRASDRGLVADLDPLQWSSILVESNGHCQYCHNDVGITHLVLEHKVSLARGGGTTLSNVTAACKHCNWSKGAKSIEEMQKIEQARRKKR